MGVVCAADVEQGKEGGMIKSKHVQNTEGTLFHLADHRGTVLYVEENGDRMKIQVRKSSVLVTKSEAEEIIVRMKKWVDGSA